MLFWPFIVWINCSSGLKIFANYLPSVSNFKCFPRPPKHFFLTVGQNNFGNKILFCSVQLEMQDAIFLAFENRLSTHTLNCWKQREKIAYYIWPGSDLLQIGPLKSDRNWTITQAASLPHKNNYEIFFKFGAKSFMKSYVQ